MTIDYDPIPVLQAAGYTEREAAFLYLAALHSGYFLRRQYLRFIERGRGALAAQFLRRAFALGHIQSIACGQARFVYHLCAGQVYEVAGLAASRHRRLKGDTAIKSRLMVLDFVLDHLGETMLDTREAKVSHFTGTRGMDVALLPSSHGVAFAEEFPILIYRDKVRFTFFDEGALSSSNFEKFLGRYRAVFAALSAFELLYLSDSNENFERARRVFAAKLAVESVPGTTPLTPRGVDHLLDYLAARQHADSGRSSLTLRDLAVLREGESIYTANEHQAILSAWQSGSLNAERVRQRFEQQAQRGKFITAVLPYSYPLHHFKFESDSKPELGSSERSIQRPVFARKTMQKQLFNEGGE
jgi:hypothetical protein